MRRSSGRSRFAHTIAPAAIAKVTLTIMCVRNFISHNPVHEARQAAGNQIVMPFRAYPHHVAGLMAGYLDKAIAKLKLRQGRPINDDARDNIIDGMLNEYDQGERQEERIIAAGIRRHNALDWTIPDERKSKKRDEQR